MLVHPLNPGIFRLDPDHVWLQHCSEGPVASTVAREVQGWLGKELRPWEVRWAEDGVGIPKALRRVCAAVMGAEASDISLTPTTSSGLGLVSLGYPWRPGDEVLAPLGEFPSNIWPWKALEMRGVSFREVPLWEGHQAGAQAWDSKPPSSGVDPEERILRAVSLRTRIVTVSWVRFQDGLKLDLGRLGKALRERGVHLVVDGIQGAGTALPDLTHVSAFATGGHKGLLAPQGLGFLWTHPDFRKVLTPTGSWLSVEGFDDWGRPSTDHARSWLEDGRRLEPGVPNLLSATALLEALEVIQRVGVPAISEHVRALQDRLLGALRILPDWKEEVYRLRNLLECDRLGSILAFHHGGRGPEAMSVLLEQGLRQGLYASVREGYLRIAFHGWHAENDLPRIVNWMAQGTGTQAPI